MKRVLILMLAVCLCLALCACGGGSGSGGTTPTKGDATTTTAPKEDSVVGFYELVAIEDAEGYVEMSAEGMNHINPDEVSYVIMKEGNTGVVFMEFEEYTVTYDGSSFEDEDGFAVDYDFKDGRLVLYFDDVTFYYEKADREGPTEGVELGGDAFPADVAEAFEGDWHGWCEFSGVSGIFADEELEFEIIARFAFDADGNCEPFFAIATEDPSDNFQNVTATYDSYGEFMLFDGELFGTTIEEGNLIELGGSLSGTIVLEEGDDYASISFCMRRVGDTWDEDYDYPCMPEDVQNYYADMEWLDIADSYGVDLDEIPEV